MIDRWEHILIFFVVFHLLCERLGNYTSAVFIDYVASEKHKEVQEAHRDHGESEAHDQPLTIISSHHSLVDSEN